MASILLTVLATVLCGTFLITRDVPVIGGSILASGAGEEWLVRILSPLIMFGALVLSCFLPGQLMEQTSALIGGVPEQILFPVGIATIATAVITSLISRFPAAPLAFVGALAGLSKACGTLPGWSAGTSYLLSWIIAPLLCGALAAGIYVLLAKSVRRHRDHYILMEARLLKAATIASLLLAAAFAYNNAPLLCLLPAASAVSAPAAAGIAAGSALLLCFFGHRRIFSTAWSMVDNELDTNSLTTFSLICAMALVFALFSFGFVSKVGLAATPLPAGMMFVSALTGISLTRKRALIEGNEIGRCALAALTAPILGAVTGYSLTRIIAGDFVNTIIILSLAILVTTLAVYIRWQGRHDLQKEIMRSREQQVYSTQKSLSALEVRSEMTEKELLGKLEIKRKELVDFAVGISDQKKFMEDIYEQLKGVRSMPDGPEKDAGIDSLLTALRERMYFTREMNDFYARSEVLNKDFNMHLSERFPDLTEAERKLANLLRQGFSSKYIASLMNITPKSVEISRYRLRTKLGLQRSDNLIQFIKSI